MSDNKILKKLQKKLGTEVAQNQTLVAMEGQKHTQIKDEFLQLFSARNIPQTEIDTTSFDSSNYIIIRQTISRAEIATTAIRIDSYGNDLLLELRQYEKSAKSDGRRVTIGTVLTGLGALFFWTGIGLAALVGGLAMLVFMKSKFSEDSAERQSSELLFSTVMETLFTTLTNCDVDPNVQLRTTF